MKCSKCKLHYRTTEEQARADAGGARCRCMEHCPCRGLCAVGCPCEAVLERREKAAAARRDPCVKCRCCPEARPGLRLCRACLIAAAAALERIQAEEAPAKRAGEVS